jgi:hypothetical protein
MRDRPLPLLVHRDADRSPATLDDAELEEELTLAALSRVPSREQRYEALLAEKRRRQFLRRTLTLDPA